MKNLKSGFIVPLLIIIIAALTIGGGVYIHEQNKKVANQQSELSLNSSNDIENSATSTPKSYSPDTLGWKTYTNPDYQISFNYPANAEVKFTNHVVPHGTDLALHDRTTGKDNFIIKDGYVSYVNDNYSYGILYFWVMQAPEPNLPSELKAEYKNFPNVSMENIQINGVSAIKIRYNSGTPEASTRIWIQNKNHAYAFNYKDKYASVALQILNSFKFTAPGTD